MGLFDATCPVLVIGLLLLLFVILAILRAGANEHVWHGLMPFMLAIIVTLI